MTESAMPRRRPMARGRPNSGRFVSALHAALLGLALVCGWRSSAAEDRPVYVGARACAACHEGPGMGNQHSRWLLSRHAGAYASLSTPEAREMARISGIPGEPEETPICLGCHATGAAAEEWEKDPGFRIEDGVQCEKCHGPGSEYMAEEVMRDREAAMRAGLRMPARRDCEKCHYVKGSHVAVHERPQLDLDEALRRIAHPTPDGARAGTLPRPAAAEPAAGRPSYLGVQECAGCHSGPAMGYQFSRWRLSAHARAYAVLATAEAGRIAADGGVDGDPQQSPACLRCHATGWLESAGGFGGRWAADEGVGCEACHGPGSEYSAEAIMRDRRAAVAAGLRRGGREVCRPCHDQAHGRPFDYEAAARMIAHPGALPAPAAAARYKTPLNLALSPDGGAILVACEGSDSVIAIDGRSRRVMAEIPVGRQPHDVAFSPDGRRAFVSNRLDDSVSVIDMAERRVVRTIGVGDEPHGLLPDALGRRLYVLNTSADSISIVDLTTWAEASRLSAGRNPWSLALSADGRSILVTSTLSNFVGFREASRSEVTMIDAGSGRVAERIVAPEANLMQGVAWHPGGAFALVTLNRTKNLLPMTRILQGWTITNGLGIVWRDGRIDQVLLDEPNLHFADAADVAFSTDGRLALVTSSGTDRVAVVDVERLLGMLASASPEERARVLPNHLGKSIDFVIEQIPVRHSPRGIVAGGRFAWVANALDDSISVIDLESLTVIDRIDLGGPREITRERRGERLFNSAGNTFQRQFSCHSCHPDGHVDGITYDIEADGIGVNPVDNRTLRGILDTDPFKWVGTNPSLARQCGARLAVFFTRLVPFTPEELESLVSYVRTIPRPPNRHRPLGADLTPAQRRGKAVFERTVTNGGRVIDEANRCVTCHFPPLFTDRSRRDVGTRMRLDTQGEFDVPHLNNIYDSAPYLHNGIAATLEEIWTRYNPDDRHGVTNDMTKDQLNDLIEYLKTL
jgi:YVTN family beta-propeller protein